MSMYRITFNNNHTGLQGYKELQYNDSPQDYLRENQNDDDCLIVRINDDGDIYAVTLYQVQNRAPGNPNIATHPWTRYSRFSDHEAFPGLPGRDRDAWIDLVRDFLRQQRKY